MTDTPDVASPAPVEPAVPSAPSTDPAPPPPSAPSQTRAQRLAERLGKTPSPPGPVKTRSCLLCGHGRAPRYKRGDHLGVILERRGTLDVHLVRKPIVFAATGAYNVEGAGFYVERTIPRGSILTLWPEGDPEPFTAREPKGYGAAFFARLVGGTVSHAFRGAFDSKVPLSRNARIAFLIAFLCGAAAVAFWWLRSQGA